MPCPCSDGASMKHRAASPIWTFAARLVVTGLAAALTSFPVWGQTNPRHGTLSRSDGYADQIPLADYLGLLQQIAPAAEAGARAYLAAFQQRCGRPMCISELRRALSQGDGDPVLMGLIRASHLQDAAAQIQWARQMRCPGGGAR